MLSRRALLMGATALVAAPVVLGRAPIVPAEAKPSPDHAMKMALEFLEPRMVLERRYMSLAEARALFGPNPPAIRFKRPAYVDALARLVARQPGPIAVVHREMEADLRATGISWARVRMGDDGEVLWERVDTEIPEPPHVKRWMGLCLPR